jgi:glycosyltransferase involved in cell wall biosynthesis
VCGARFGERSAGEKLFHWVTQFICPFAAHNEQACLGRTLQAIHESARATGLPYEIIVANDASTDATAEIAQKNGARVVNVELPSKCRHARRGRASRERPRGWCFGCAAFG